MTNSSRRTMLLTIAILILGLGLAACAGPAATEAPTQEAQPTATPKPAQTEAPAETEEMEEPAEALSIQHALGAMELEEPAQRVVALEWTYVEDLLAVGVQPVGVADIEGYQKWVNIEPQLAESVEDVGTRQEPSLETIAALEPDLIIGVQFRHEVIYEDLNSIAPTLIFSPYPGPDGPNQYEEMRQTFRTIGQAVGQEEAAGQVLEDMDAVFAEASEQLQEAGFEGARFGLAQAFTFQEAATIRLFSQNAMASIVLEQLGLVNAWTVDYEQYGFSTVDVEALAEIQDAHFFYVVQEDDNVFANQLAENPIWNNLEFVEEGRTYPLGGDTWLFGGPLSNELVAEKVVEVLTAE